MEQEWPHVDDSRSWVTGTSSFIIAFSVLLPVFQNSRRKSLYRINNLANNHYSQDLICYGRKLNILLIPNPQSFIQNSEYTEAVNSFPPVPFPHRSVARVQDLDPLKSGTAALAGVVQWVAHQPANQKVRQFNSWGQAPSWGCAGGNQTMFLSLSFPLPSPLSRNE